MLSPSHVSNITAQPFQSSTTPCVNILPLYHCECESPCGASLPDTPIQKYQGIQSFTPPSDSEIQSHHSISGQNSYLSPLKPRSSIGSCNQWHLRSIIPTPVSTNVLEMKEYKLITQTGKGNVVELVAKQLAQETQVEPFCHDGLLGLPHYIQNLDSISLCSCGDVKQKPSTIAVEADLLSMQEWSQSRLSEGHSKIKPDDDNQQVHYHVFGEHNFTNSVRHRLSITDQSRDLINDNFVQAESTNEWLADTSCNPQFQTYTPTGTLLDRNLTSHAYCKNQQKANWNGTSRQRHSKQTGYRRPRKIAVVGDMSAGKTMLIRAYSEDKFSQMYVPTILRSCMTDTLIHGEKIELVVVEVSGRLEYTKLRECAFQNADAIILCYSCDNISSLDNVRSHWLPELQTYIPNVPYILVGTKKDIREEILIQFEQMTASEEKAQKSKTTGNYLKSLKERLVSAQRGYEMAQSIKAHSFHECSARYRDGTRHVFEKVSEVSLKFSRRKVKVQRVGAHDSCNMM